MIGEEGDSRVSTSSDGQRRDRDRERGQTTQDFAMGIGIFLVTIAFVFAFVPTTLTFSTADPGAAEAKQANRAATELISDFSAAGKRNILDGTAMAEYANRTNASDLQTDLSLPVTAQINVTLRTLDKTGTASMPDRTGNDIDIVMGQRYGDQPAAEVSRIVQVTNDDGSCDPGCRLVVRVW